MAATIFARYFSILLALIWTHNIHITEITCPTDVYCVRASFMKSLKHFKVGKRNLPSRPISRWHKHGHILLYRPFKLDLTIFMDVELNPGPTGHDALVHGESFKCMNDGRTNVVTLDFNRINYGSPCLGHARYVYSRDELLQIRCCVSGVSSPVFYGYKSMLFKGTKAKYRRCRAGKKVKERIRYLANSIPVVVKPCSSRSQMNHIQMWNFHKNPYYFMSSFPGHMTYVHARRYNTRKLLWQVS